jgi:hypothetical protein
MADSAVFSGTGPGERHITIVSHALVRAEDAAKPITLHSTPLTSLGISMAAAPPPPPPPGGLPTKRKMSTQELWAARQLDLLAAGEVNLEAALKRPSLVYARPRATTAASTAAAPEITDLTGGSSSTVIPCPQSIGVGNAPTFAGPSLADLARVFLTPPTAASNRVSSSSRAPAGRSRSWSVPPPIGTPDFSKARPQSRRFR